MPNIRYDLSVKQSKVYDFICKFQKEHGYPPTVREIANGMGLSSPSTAHSYICILEEKGYVRRKTGCVRALEIT